MNINYGHNRELMEKCKLLSEYSQFFDILDKKIDMGMRREDAINQAIDYCVENGILEEFLRKHQAEVLGMLLYDFDAKKYERTIREEGREEGRMEERANTLKEKERADKAEAEVARLREQLEQSKM